jgi:hypothetical protein
MKKVVTITESQVYQYVVDTAEGIPGADKSTADLIKAADENTAAILCAMELHLRLAAKYNGKGGSLIDQAVEYGHPLFKTNDLPAGVKCKLGHQTEKVV